jgi:hypothetical protein
LETDDGERLSGKSVGRELLDDWDLDLDEYRRTAELGSTLGRKPPKLVHKLMFSMPPGTPAEGVLAAARNFLREEFALKHRYAFVLHTDEPHPHVHAVVKAISEQGIRLNIRKATLRKWRSEFARHLRAVGIEANATERAVRGESRKSKKDGIYRASQRGDSTYMRAQAEAVARDLLTGDSRADLGRHQLVETRKQVLHGWSQVASVLGHGEQHRLADEVRRFIAGMDSPRSGRDIIAAELARDIHVRRELGRGQSR